MAWIRVRVQQAPPRPACGERSARRSAPGEGLYALDRPKPLTPSLSLWEREPTESAARPGAHPLRRLALVGFLILLVLILPALALVFPTLSGRVVDEASILDEATRAALTQKLADLE